MFIYFTVFLPAINPCSKQVCDPHADCLYLGPNSHRCTCQYGYKGDGQVCIPVDPCQTKFGNCPPESSACKYDGPGKVSVKLKQMEPNSQWGGTNPNWDCHRGKGSVPCSQSESVTHPSSPWLPCLKEKSIRSSIPREGSGDNDKCPVAPGERDSKIASSLSSVAPPKCNADLEAALLWFFLGSPLKGLLKQRKLHATSPVLRKPRGVQNPSLPVFSPNPYCFWPPEGLLRGREASGGIGGRGVCVSKCQHLH